MKSYYHGCLILTLFDRYDLTFLEGVLQGLNQSQKYDICTSLSFYFDGNPNLREELIAKYKGVLSLIEYEYLY